jgi:elongation factor 1-beta
MANAIIKMRIMPDSPQANLEAIRKEIERRVKENKGMISRIEDEPVAFGIKALNAIFLWPEEQDTSIIEDSLSSIKNVSSAQIIDYRREFG